VQGCGPWPQFAVAGTESGAKYTAHVWGRRGLGCMVVAHATMHGGCYLASSFGQRVKPLAMAVWPHNEASLLFVEAPVQLCDSWASCAHPHFIKTCQKVFRPDPFMRSIISSSCPVRVILSFRFHIHDLYLVFISFENVLEFFFPSPFFCIISTWSPTYVCNFSILIPHRTSFIEFQSVQTHSGM
jgi:hypothetical protein